METRYPVQGSFGNEFTSIYNHCRFLAAWSSNRLKKSFFCVFFGKTTPFGKISKIMFLQVHCSSSSSSSSRDEYYLGGTIALLLQDHRTMSTTGSCWHCTVFVSPIDVLCSHFVNFGRREIGKVVRNLPDKKNKISPRSPALATARIAPKICKGQPRQCTLSAPDFIQIGSLSAELYPNAWTPLQRVPKWIQYSAEAQFRAE